MLVACLLYTSPRPGPGKAGGLGLWPEVCCPVARVFAPSFRCRPQREGIRRIFDLARRVPGAPPRSAPGWPPAAVCSLRQPGGPSLPLVVPGYPSGALALFSSRLSPGASAMAPRTTPSCLIAAIIAHLFPAVKGGLPSHSMPGGGWGSPGSGKPGPELSLQARLRPRRSCPERRGVREVSAGGLSG